MKTVSTGLTRARISSAALALDPIPAQTIKVYPTHNKNAELDKHNSEDFTSIALGVIVIPMIPWGYVFRHYLKKPGARWR